MVYWLFFLAFALGITGMLAFGGPELQSTAMARLWFFALALTFVLSILAAFLRFHGGASRRPHGPRRS